MAYVRFFAVARDLARVDSVQHDGSTVGDILATLRIVYGSDFSTMLDHCAVYVNDEPAALDVHISDEDEIAILPPVSGG